MGTNFIINYNMPGFESVSIDDKRLLSGQNTVVIILDASTNDALNSYYNTIIGMILAGSRVICISVGQTSKIRKAIMMLMASYRAYDIYKVSDASLLTQEYLEKVIERHPGLEEVQQYIGGDVSAYSELNSIILGVTNLVQSGDLDGLKTFIEQHIESIESSCETVEYLRKVADATNSGELNELIRSLRDKVAKTAKENADIESELNGYKESNSKLSDKVSVLERDLAKANAKVSALSSDDGAQRAGVISAYKEINTAREKCNVKNILYFKEVSYVRYTNSFVTNLFEFLSNFYKNGIKLVIFDSKVGIPGVYNGISIYSTTEFLGSKQQIINTSKKFVAPEPNPVILSSILENVSSKTDILIVYDRLGQLEDLIAGNNVAKIVVVNSFTQYNNVRARLKLSSNTLVISGDEFDGAFNIRTIPGYAECTPSAKVAKYSKIEAFPGSSERLIQALTTRAKLPIRLGN